MFSLNLAYGIELKETEVSLPLGLSQLDKRSLKAGESEVKYKVKLYQNNNQTVILPKIINTNSIDGFMSSLIYSYIKQDKNLFKSLLSKQSAKALDINSEKFQFSFEFLKKIKKPHLRYAFEYQDGYIISWSAIGLITDRIIFLKKVGNDFKMFNLSVAKDDDMFWNLGLYFKFAPFNSYTPIQPVVKKVDTKYKINIKVHGFKNWIYIYSLSNKRKIIAVSDNFANNKQYKDYNFNANAIELKIDENEFKAMGKDLYIVESNFQLEGIPQNIHKLATKLELK